MCRFHRRFVGRVGTNSGCRWVNFFDTTVEPDHPQGNDSTLQVNFCMKADIRVRVLYMV